MHVIRVIPLVLLDCSDCVMFETISQCLASVYTACVFVPITKHLSLCRLYLALLRHVFDCLMRTRLCSHRR